METPKQYAERKLKENNIMTPQFKNNQLQFDLERLLSYDDYCYTDITTCYDNLLGYILDIKDASYFYNSEEDRDFDDNLIMEVLKENFLF